MKQGCERPRGRMRLAVSPDWYNQCRLETRKSAEYCDIYCEAMMSQWYGCI